MIFQPSTGMGKRQPTKEQRSMSQCVFRGRGLMDMAFDHMAPRLRAGLTTCILDDAIKLKCQPKDIVWRVDRSGVIHCKDVPPILVNL